MACARVSLYRKIGLEKVRKRIALVDVSTRRSRKEALVSVSTREYVNARKRKEVNDEMLC